MRENGKPAHAMRAPSSFPWLSPSNCVTNTDDLTPMTRSARIVGHGRAALGRMAVVGPKRRGTGSTHRVVHGGDHSPARTLDLFTQLSGGVWKPTAPATPAQSASAVAKRSRLRWCQRRTPPLHRINRQSTEIGPHAGSRCQGRRDDFLSLFDEMGWGCREAAGIGCTGWSCGGEGAPDSMIRLSENVIIGH